MKLNIEIHLVPYVSCAAIVTYLFKKSTSNTEFAIQYSQKLNIWAGILEDNNNLDRLRIKNLHSLQNITQL